MQITNSHATNKSIMLNSLEIKAALLSLGLEQNIDDARILGFWHSNLPHPVYVKTPSGNAKADHVKKEPFVIHSDCRAKRAEIDNISGIYPNWERIYKNSNLYGFLKLSSPKSRPMSYGVAINIESIKALASLLNILSNQAGQFRVPPLQKDEIVTLTSIEKQFETDLQASIESSAADRRKRLRLSTPKPGKIQVITTVFRRNPDVVAEVLERAKGRCELCNSLAPFLRAKDSSPYLEVHHLVELSNGGDDTIENAIALCPNCHRYKHFGI